MSFQQSRLKALDNILAGVGGAVAAENQKIESARAQAMRMQEVEQQHLKALERMQEEHEATERMQDDAQAHARQQGDADRALRGFLGKEDIRIREAGLGLQRENLKDSREKMTHERRANAMATQRFHMDYYRGNIREASNELRGLTSDVMSSVMNKDRIDYLRGRIAAGLRAMSQDPVLKGMGLLMDVERPYLPPIITHSTIQEAADFAAEQELAVKKAREKAQKKTEGPSMFDGVKSFFGKGQLFSPLDLISRFGAEK